MKAEYLYKAKVIEVTDGDTLKLLVDLGFRCSRTVKVRLVGINCDETRGVAEGTDEYTRGRAAKKFVEDWVRRVAFTRGVFVKTHRDRKSFDRWLGTIYDCDGGSLNELLLEEGLADKWEKK